ncbi:Glycosyl hydrolase family 10 protein [Forsythia ovata]|uniref:Glycosyl hydrolase family 10 protein n=1 Tax=Forsythia ovata TaxID=205694 RepID=A0ABD1QMU6_9LAMI
MRRFVHYEVLVVLCSVLVAGRAACDSCLSSYDYSANIECLAEPLAPQYRGGIVKNPAFDSGLYGWTAFGKAKIGLEKVKRNKFIVASSRSLPNDSFSQNFHIKKDLLHTFSAWVQISEGKETVAAFLKIPDQESIVIGSVIAKSGCWSMLKGGFTLDQNLKAQLYFLSNNTRVGLWLDNVSLKPFTKEQWSKQQKKSIEKVRKRKIRIHVYSHEGKKLHGVKITINQTRPSFLLGCATAKPLIDFKAYQEWFAHRFTASSFNNEMKWYYTELNKEHENYTVPDAMISFLKKHGISIRGHNIFWDKPTMNMDWVRNLTRQELLAAAVRRMGSVMSRYSGDIFQWDVMNENLHFSYYEDRLGPNASAMFYKIAQALDPQATMFLNEYCTLEKPLDMEAIPSKYIEKLREIKSFPGNENMVVGIGLQAHFKLRPNISYIRSSLDVLGATKMPIWLTEFDVIRGPEQLIQYEEILREAYSHPAVDGIILWSGWNFGCSEECLKGSRDKTKKCLEICLTDNNFKNLPAGDLVDKLIQEWKTSNVKGFTDKNGVYEHRVFHGEYNAIFSHPPTYLNVTKKFNVTNEESQPLDIKIYL